MSSGRRFELQQREAFVIRNGRMFAPVVLRWRQNYRPGSRELCPALAVHRRFHCRIGNGGLAEKHPAVEKIAHLPRNRDSEIPAPKCAYQSADL